MNKFDWDIQLSDFRVILALLQHGTVTRAARQLGMSQSALSYQLDRMRKRLSDPLFVRSGNRMLATAFATQLATPAEKVLRILEDDVGGLVRFDPATTERTFRIGVNEIGSMTMVPKIIRRLKDAAPGALLAQIYVQPERLMQALENDEIDLAAGHFARADRDLLQRLLYRRDYVCIARRDHPRIRDRLSPQQLCREQMLRTPSTPVVDAWIAEIAAKAGLPLRAPMTTQHVSAMPMIVAASDLLAMIPREVYEIFRQVANIRTVRLTRAGPVIDVHQFWHPRNTGDPAQKFFRDLVFAATREH